MRCANDIRISSRDRKEKSWHASLGQKVGRCSPSSSFDEKKGEERKKNAAALSPPPLLLSLTCEETGDQDDRDGQEPLQRSRKVRDIDEVALGHGASGRSRGHSRRKKEVVGGVLRVGGRKGFCETRDGDGGDGAKEDEQKKKKKDGLFALALSDKPSLFLFLFTPLSRQTRAATARRREREKKRYGKKMSERRKERDRCPPF